MSESTDRTAAGVCLRAGEPFLGKQASSSAPAISVLSGAVGAVAAVSRTDPNEQESVVLLPELEAIHR